MIIKKTPEEIEKIAAAGEIHARAMQLVAGKVAAGVTTAEIDEMVERFIRSQGAEPSFKGYNGFTGSICASPNSMVVHGIPGPYTLADGDILSVDIGVTLDGWVADAACTFPVGEVTVEAESLIAVTEASLFDAVDQVQVGGRIGDISHAVQICAEADGFGVVRTLVGHGVGQSMHEDPQIPNFGPAGRGPKLEVGMVLAIEPMITAGGHAVRIAPDGWSIFTVDGSLSAHFEFTVAVTAEGPRILTPWHLLLGAAK